MDEAFSPARKLMDTATIAEQSAVDLYSTRDDLLVQETILRSKLESWGR